MQGLSLSLSLSSLACFDALLIVTLCLPIARM